MFCIVRFVTVVFSVWSLGRLVGEKGACCFAFLLVFGLNIVCCNFLALPICVIARL